MDYRVADLNLAPFGRKEINLAEHEMPGLMALYFSSAIFLIMSRVFRTSFFLITLSNLCC